MSNNRNQTSNLNNENSEDISIITPIPDLGSKCLDCRGKNLCDACLEKFADSDLSDEDYEDDGEAKKRKKRTKPNSNANKSKLKTAETSFRGVKSKNLKKAEKLISNTVINNWVIDKDSLDFLSLNNDELPKLISDLEKVENQSNPEVEKQMSYWKQYDNSEFNKFNDFLKLEYTHKAAFTSNLEREVSYVRKNLSNMEKNLIVYKSYENNTSAENEVRKVLIQTLRDDFLRRSSLKDKFNGLY